MQPEPPQASHPNVIRFSMQAASSYSSIAVAGKFEQMDITKHSDDVEEIITTSNESHLNLFNLETPSYDASYLSLFKSPEERIYENITGTQRPHKGYFNISYVGEASDTESCEEINKGILGDESGSKPKIIDFVPLDDGTKPMFNKNLLNEPNYDTLEREKTFHVLNIAAASSGAVRKSTSSIESRTIRTVTPSNSRVSFTDAKKVFEALLESNLDNTKPKPKNRESLREKTKPAKIEVRTSLGAMKKSS